MNSKPVAVIFFMLGMASATVLVSAFAFKSLEQLEQRHHFSSLAFTLELGLDWLQEPTDSVRCTIANQSEFSLNLIQGAQVEEPIIYRLIGQNDAHYFQNHINEQIQRAEKMKLIQILENCNSESN